MYTKFSFIEVLDQVSIVHLIGAIYILISVEYYLQTWTNKLDELGHNAHGSEHEIGQSTCDIGLTAQ